MSNGTTADAAEVQAFGEKMMQGYTPDPQGGGDLLPCPFCGKPTPEPTAAMFGLDGVDNDE